MSALATTTARGDDGTWVVTLHGEHDLATRPALARETHPIWSRCRVAIVDLSDASFIDSGMIRWLLDVERQLEEAGAFTLSIVEGPPGAAVARLFRHLRMHHVLACYPTLEDALAQVPGGSEQPARPARHCQGVASRCAA